MRRYSEIADAARDLSACSVAIGTFDGVHLGHRKVIETAVQEGHRLGIPTLVFTFQAHPLATLAPERAPELLTTSEQRVALFEQIGADAVLAVDFKVLSGLTADQFLKDVLVGQLGAKSIAVGTDFRFGKDRRGDVDLMRDLAVSLGYSLETIGSVEHSGIPVHSSKIRELLKTGEPQKAEELLGHPFWLTGKVVKGLQLGRTLGYPTANLEPSYRQVIPLDGIYAVLARTQDGLVHGGACSIGSRPTIEGAGRSLETYLFDFNSDIYDQQLDLRFLAYLRPEAKFNTLEALVAQIDEDCRQARLIVNPYLL